MSKAKTVPCEACRGTGARALKPHEIQTIEAIRRLGMLRNKWTTSSAILANINIRAARRLAHTALANRLRDLREIGLVERRMFTPASGGREYEWRLA